MRNFQVAAFILALVSLAYSQAQAAVIVDPSALDSSVPSGLTDSGLKASPRLHDTGDGSRLYPQDVRIVDSSGNASGGTFAGAPGYTTNGGRQTAAIPSGVIGPTVLKGYPGQIAKILITAAGTTSSEIFYDNATTCTGTIVGVAPGANQSATVGQLGNVLTPQFSLANGLTACGAVGSPAVTVSWW